LTGAKNLDFGKVPQTDANHYNSVENAKLGINRSEAEFKEFDPGFKFQPRL